jgi:uncharacterized protein YndB with AHSA1/START domain
MGHPSSDQTMTIFGRHLDIVRDARIVWTNDEGDQDGPVITVTFKESEGEMLVTFHDLYPSKESLDEVIASGSISGWGEQLQQFEAILADPGARAEGA